LYKTIFGKLIFGGTGYKQVWPVQCWFEELHNQEAGFLLSFRTSELVPQYSTQVLLLAATNGIEAGQFAAHYCKVLIDGLYSTIYPCDCVQLTHWLLFNKYWEFVQISTHYRVFDTVCVMLYNWKGGYEAKIVEALEQFKNKSNGIPY
jgi:hypothetical protein